MSSYLAPTPVPEWTPGTTPALPTLTQHAIDRWDERTPYWSIDPETALAYATRDEEIVCHSYFERPSTPETVAIYVYHGVGPDLAAYEAWRETEDDTFASMPDHYGVVFIVVENDHGGDAEEVVPTVFPLEREWVDDDPLRLYLWCAARATTERWIGEDSSGSVRGGGS